MLKYKKVMYKILASIIVNQNNIALSLLKEIKINSKMKTRRYVRFIFKLNFIFYQKLFIIK
jgi:hypothetical protein